MAFRIRLARAGIAVLTAAGLAAAVPAAARAHHIAGSHEDHHSIVASAASAMPASGTTTRTGTLERLHGHVRGTRADVDAWALATDAGRRFTLDLDRRT